MGELSTFDGDSSTVKLPFSPGVRRWKYADVYPIMMKFSRVNQKNSVVTRLDNQKLIFFLKNENTAKQNESYVDTVIE